MSIRKLLNFRILEEEILSLFRQGVTDKDDLMFELSNTSVYMLPSKFFNNKEFDSEAFMSYLEEVLGKFESRKLVENIYKSKLISPENEKKFIIYNPKTDTMHGEINTMTVKELLKGERYKSLVMYGIYEGYNPKLNKRFYEEYGKQFFNCYQPPEWREENWYKNAPIAEAPIPECYLNFFKHLTNNRENDLNYFLDWLAISLQKRNFTYLVTVGAQGVGKGVAGKIMKELHGSSNFVELGTSNLKKQFNKQLKNRTLVYFNEALEISGEVAEKVKLLNEETMEVELKGVDAEVTRNYANYYFSSNNYDAFQIDEGNRRFSFIDLTDKRYEYDKQNGDELFKPENIKQFAYHLYTRRYNPKWETYVYKSETTELILESRYSEWQVYILEDFYSKYSGNSISIKDLISHLKNKNYWVKWGELRNFLLNNKSKFGINSKASPKDASLFYDYSKLQLSKDVSVLETTAKTTSLLNMR